MNDSETLQPARAWFDVESLPSWLVSLGTHMGLILILGLLYQTVPKEAGVELSLDYEADPGLTFHTPVGIVRSTLASQPRRFELCLRALYKFS